MFKSRRILFIVCILTWISAVSFAQTVTVDLSFRNATLKTVISEIEKQTDYTFMYHNDIDREQSVSVQVKKEKLGTVLNKIFSPMGIIYEITNKQIILKKKPANTSKKLTGIIRDDQGIPVIGANVVEKGTTNGTITDINGEFILDMPESGIIQVSYIGYNTQDVKIGTDNTVDVRLTEDTQKLEEVVVVGYGSMKKRDLTGAVSQLKGDDIADLPLRSASDALQGKAAGVTITSTSGSPGSMGTVRIRGVGTINNNDPLYVVDGLPQTGIGWLNPRDIESMEVLKDASAQAIYGARAANGVILITTKKGTAGTTYKTTLEFDMLVGFQNAEKTYDMLDAEGFMKYKNMAYEASNKPLLDDFSTPEKREAILAFLENNGGRAGTNWWNEIENPNAISQTYNLSLSGGIDKMRYRSSFGYMKQDGIVKATDYERLTGRVNLDSDVFKWLKVSSNTNVIYEMRRNTRENDAYSSTVFSALTADPITPAYRNNLTGVPDFLESRIMDGYEPTNPFSQYAGILYSNKPNPLAQTDRLGQNVWKGLQLKANVSAEIKLFRFLSFKSSIGLDLSRTASDSFSPKYYLNATDQVSDATVGRNIGQTDYWVFDNYFSYNDKFGKHTVSAMAGMSAEKNRYETTVTSKQGLVNNDKSQQILNAATKNPTSSGAITISSLNSYFGRLFYSYADKYMLTANIRWDGSSNFAAGNKWGVFPSVSGGWYFSEESFIKEAIGDWFSQGKLRVAWGEIGNQDVTSGAYLTKFANSSYYMVGEPLNPWLSGGRSNVGNPDLRWETTRQLDFGLDLAFFNNALKVNIDYFDRETSDMLVQVPIPASVGLPNTPWSNAGSVSNKGFEFVVDYQGHIGREFNYNVNGNISTYKNKVISLGGGTNIPGKTHLGNQVNTMIEPGKPIGYFYGYKMDGVFQTQQEIDNYRGGPDNTVIMPKAEPGDLKFLDLNNDGKLGEEDRTMIGNPHPDFTFGLTLGADYKGFDFSVFFQGSVGNDILNILKYDIYSGTGWYNAPKDIFDKFWSGPGSTNENFAISANSRDNLTMSEWFIEDGSYVRLKNLTVGYTIPESLTKKITIKNLRVFVAAQNLFTITGYSGLDPELGNTNPQFMGIDMGWYPQARSFMFGLSMKL
ncbi:MULTISPECIES: SusC/RagA family TonB-linked outer membrane protein [Parabacteroides]|uniref:SusC/RagA family TonB-linked outer membrane protein n=1 Tax=Parabacteroides provencensis TaxID=1944636 RepID=UPI0018ED825E|nr:SusC/RagA family TonB-linked outer membrane protein [Parabacteroides provencensis]